MECRQCPVSCGIDRNIAIGRCGVRGLSVARAALHHFEEPPISHQNGSGTIFFGGCNLKCVFCQNYDLSRAEKGKEISPVQLAQIFRDLESAGAENINLVTPDHVIRLITEALSIYKPKIPIVYNTGSYVLVSELKLIDPYVDIYLPDLKFYSPELSKRYTGRSDYFEFASKAIEFMAQKPILFRSDGKMLSGILTRHLVLPMCVSDSIQILSYLITLLPKEAPLSIMRQYTPMGKIDRFPELNRTVTAREYRRVLEYAIALGFEHLFTQDKDSAKKCFIPDWDF